MDLLSPLQFFFFNDTATTEIYTLSLHDALPIARERYGPPTVAGLTARPSRRREARDDSESGDRSLSFAPAVRARPGPLRRAVRAAACRAERGEPGGGAGGAGGSIRRDRRPGGA